MTFFRRLISEIGSDDVSGASAELAYRLFLAIFPFFIFLAALGGFASDLFGVQNPTEEIMAQLADRLPSDAASVLRTQLDEVINGRNLGLSSIGIVAAIWAASSGVGTLIKEMNRIYEVEETRKLWSRYAIAVGTTVLAGGALTAAFAMLFVGQLYGQDIADDLGYGGSTAIVFTYGRVVVTFIALLVTTAYLYWALPNARLPFKWITPGALLFTISWLAFTVLFGIYVANFGSYNATYGALGGFVVVLVWLYLSGFILLLGVEVNAVLASMKEPAVLPEKAESLGEDPYEQPDDDEDGAIQQAKQTAVLTLIAFAIMTAWRIISGIFRKRPRSRTATR